VSLAPDGRLTSVLIVKGRRSCLVFKHNFATLLSSFRFADRQIAWYGIYALVGAPSLCSSQCCGTSNLRSSQKLDLQ